MTAQSRGSAGRGVQGDTSGIRAIVAGMRREIDRTVRRVRQTRPGSRDALKSRLAGDNLPAMTLTDDAQELAVIHATRPLQAGERAAFLTALKAHFAGRTEIGDGELGRTCSGSTSGRRLTLLRMPDAARSDVRAHPVVPAAQRPCRPALSALAATCGG
jgi:hypothetical protein